MCISVHQEGVWRGSGDGCFLWVDVWGGVDFDEHPAELVEAKTGKWRSTRF